MSLGPLLVVAGAAVGAPLRYVVARHLASPRVPWGVLVVNVIGSCVLGVLVGADASDAWYRLVGAGFCGALTTWSTLAYDVWRRWEDRCWSSGAGYLAASVALGAAAFWSGMAIA